jgi:hypothetical protein
LPNEITKAELVITTSNGMEIFKEKIIGRGEGVIDIDATSLAGGTYFYSLVVDEIRVETHSFILHSNR